MDCRPALGTPRAMKINFFSIKKSKKKQEMRKIQSLEIKESCSMMSVLKQFMI